MPAPMVEEDEEKSGIHIFKRRKTSGNNILRKLSISGNKKRESIIYKQMKDEMEEEEEGGGDNQANVRFKSSVIQINQSNPNSPIKEVEKQGLFRRFRESFRLKNSRSSSESPGYGTLEGEEIAGDDDKENMVTDSPEPADDVNTAENGVIAAENDVIKPDVVAAEAEEFTEILVDDVLSDSSSIKRQLTGVENQTAYKFSDSAPSPPTWKQRLYRSFRKSKQPKKEETSPTTFKRRYSLPSFKRKKKGLAYEAL